MLNFFIITTITLSICSRENHWDYKHNMSIKSYIYVNNISQERGKIKKNSKWDAFTEKVLCQNFYIHIPMKIQRE